MMNSYNWSISAHKNGQIPNRNAIRSGGQQVLHEEEEEEEEEVQVFCCLYSPMIAVYIYIYIYIYIYCTHVHNVCKEGSQSTHTAIILQIKRVYNNVQRSNNRSPGDSARHAHKARRTPGAEKSHANPSGATSAS